MSPIGPSHQFAATPHFVAFGAKRTLTESRLQFQAWLKFQPRRKFAASPVQGRLPKIRAKRHSMPVFVADKTKSVRE
jgi:hypothetical protein